MHDFNFDWQSDQYSWFVKTNQLANSSHEFIEIYTALAQIEQHQITEKLLLQKTTKEQYCPMLWKMKCYKTAKALFHRSKINLLAFDKNLS